MQQQPASLRVFVDFTSRQLFEHNLGGFLNILSIARITKPRCCAIEQQGVLISLISLPLKVAADAFHPIAPARRLVAYPPRRRCEFFDKPPVSLYGARLAPETVALEYGTRLTPVWVNRCGVLVSGSVRHTDQGIFSYGSNAL
jgi:hypothetical protein